jgi:tetratricopeptide (TPR) repeat protein
MAVDTKKIISSLQTRLERLPESLGFARLADLQRQAGAVDQALETCRRGLEKNPGHAAGHLVLGRCFLEQSKLDEARAHLQQALDLNGLNPAAWRGLAEIAVQTKDLARAAHFFRLLSEFDPFDDELADSYSQYARHYQEPDIFMGLDDSPAKPKNAPAGTGAEPETAEPETVELMDVMDPLTGDIISPPSAPAPAGNADLGPEDILDLLDTSQAATRDAEAASAAPEPALEPEAPVAVLPEPAGTAEPPAVESSLLTAAAAEASPAEGDDLLENILASAGPETAALPAEPEPIRPEPAELIESPAVAPSLPGDDRAEAPDETTALLETLLEENVPSAPANPGPAPAAENETEETLEPLVTEESMANVLHTLAQKETVVFPALTENVLQPEMEEPKTETDEVWDMMEGAFTGPVEPGPDAKPEEKNPPAAPPVAADASPPPAFSLDDMLEEGPVPEDDQTGEPALTEGAGEAEDGDEEAESEVADVGPDLAGVATETMATVFLQQGYRQKALEIYEKLLAANRQDPRLLQKVQELAAAVSGETGDTENGNQQKPLAGRKIKKEFKKNHQTKTTFKRKKNAHDDE